jgi:integrase/recombinase XerD
MLPKEWKTEIIVYDGEKRIAVRFEKRFDWIQEIRKLPGARWSPVLKAWHIRDCEEHRKKLGIALNDKVKNGLVAIPEEQGELKQQLNYFTDWMRSRRYSEHTVSVYIQTLQVFFQFYPNKKIKEITNDDVLVFNRKHILEKKLSASYQSQFVNALKLFYGLIMEARLDIEKLVRPKNPVTLPKVLDETEIAALIENTSNKKHKSMLSLIYSAGLRRGELLNLKMTDIDSARMMIHIRNAKGMKDRIVPLSPLILNMLRTYYQEYQPSEFLFEGQYGGKYSERSVELVLKKAAKRAGLKRDVNLHMLRHSYATHLLEGGTSLRHIQELLGHKSPKTTQIYTYVSREELGRIQSPFDRLGIKK